MYTGVGIIDSFIVVIACNIWENVQVSCFNNDFDWLTLQFVNYWKGNGIETVSGDIQVECNGHEEAMTSQEVKNITYYS